jgi:hypothetical protein
MTLLIAAGCVRAQPQNASGPGEWPSYWAQLYQDPGHPTLTRSQVALIRKTLVLLKPCQIAQLRYAFPRDSGLDFVLYFFSKDPLHFQPAVLWSYDADYDQVEGGVISLPGDASEPDDDYLTTVVQKQPCM